MQKSSRTSEELRYVPPLSFASEVLEAFRMRPHPERAWIPFRASFSFQQLGCSLGARAISHLEQISDEGIAAMAATKAAAVVLPTTAHILRLTPPPLRKMIERGVIVALGSDFNPNAYCYAMVSDLTGENHANQKRQQTHASRHGEISFQPTVMHLACVQYRMNLEEALAAATINAAYSIGMSEK